MTGIKKPNVIRAIKRLLSKKIITVINIDNAPATTYGINKDYSKWQSLSKKITLSKKIITVIKKDNASLSKKIPTKETTTKETITKEITPISPKRKNEKIELPEWLSQDLWEQFKEHRVFIKSKLSLKAEQINLNKLIELHNQGHDHKKLIEESIAHNWKSFYEPKNGNHPLTGKFSPNTIQTIENLQKFIERGKNEE